MNDRMTEQIVRVGYTNSMKPVSFVGEFLTKDSNQDQGPNQDRYHVWQLYGLPLGIVEERRYRVLDSYCTHWQNEEGYNELSGPLMAQEVAGEFPYLCDIMISEGICSPKELAEKLD